MIFKYISNFNDAFETLVEGCFISFIYSSWHLDVFYSWAIANKLKNGIIIVLPQSDVKDESRFRLNRASFLININNTQVYFLQDVSIKFKLKNLLKYIIKPNRNKTLLIFNPGGVNYLILSKINLTDRAIKYIKIDEGTSTYLPNGKKGLLNRKKNVSYFKEFTSITLNKSKIIAYQLFNKLSSISFCEAYLFIKQNGSLVVNKEIANNLFNYYNKLELTNISFEKNSVLLLKDYDIEIMSSQIIIELYDKIFQLLQKLDVTVYLKKHPNDINIEFDELLKRYSFIKFIDSNYSAEIIISQIEPSLVIGGISTSIFTIPSIYQVKTISYMRLYQNYKEINPLYNDRINILADSFQRISSRLNIVKSYNHFNKLLINEK